MFFGAKKCDVICCGNKVLWLMQKIKGNFIRSALGQHPKTLDLQMYDDFIGNLAC